MKTKKITWFFLSVLILGLVVFYSESKAGNAEALQGKTVENPRLLSRANLSKEKLYINLEEALKEPNKVFRLKLKYNTLTTEGKFPEEVFKLTKLQELIIEGNKIKELSDNIGTLTDLQFLNLGGNPIKAVPSAIGKLVYLKELELNSASLGSFPDEIEKLVSLEKITCVSCSLTVFPVALTKIKGLKEINFNSNKLTNIPAEISKLSNLTYLGLMLSELTVLPNEIGQIKSLNKLHLNGNKLKELPSSVGDLSNLNELLVDRNELSTLPEAISKLSNLKGIGISGNYKLDYKQACIVMAKIPSLKRLDMSSMKPSKELTSLPKELSELQIETLTLNSNFFKDANADVAIIAAMPNLTALFLGNNDFKKIPTPLFEMNKLKYLGLSPNKEIPKEEFEKLKKALPTTNIPNIY